MSGRLRDRTRFGYREHMRSVVVVEDDEAIREDLAELLADEGYAVIAARDGVDALERIAGADVGLFLLDLMMPRMDGWELRARLRADPAHADVPVILISGAGDGPAAAASLGVAAYLKKPFDVDRLLALVAEHLRA